MPSHKQTAKRLKQDRVRRLRNKGVKKRIHTMVKKLTSTGESDEAQSLLRSTISLIDSAAKRNVIHWRRAARKKSRLTRAVNKKLAAAS
ncbi:MAG: 30S ribosomal protein S20 [bacterium]